jgi:hypothetical protein
VTTVASVAREFWIAEIRVTAATEAKLRSKHNLTSDEVRSACVPDKYIRASWHTHHKHGKRLFVEARDRYGNLRIVLQPVNVAEGIWRLRTAWRKL